MLKSNIQKCLNCSLSVFFFFFIDDHLYALPSEVCFPFSLALMHLDPMKDYQLDLAVLLACLYSYFMVMGTEL